MPGGQFTNLKAQARSLGLEDRWHQVAETYAEVNRMFGDIVKVTPSSKVVGDMALMMVAQGLTPAQVLDPAVEVSFPDSVVDMMKGNLGQPPGGWPEAIQKKVLKGEAPITDRPGAHLPPVDIEAMRAKLSEDLGVEIDDEDLNGYLMYPKVFTDYRARQETYGPVRTLPTRNFFYGMEAGDEISVEIDPGKTLEVRLQTIGDTDDAGEVGGAEAGINRTHLGADLAELRPLGGDSQVAHDRRHVAAADGVALDARDHRLGHVADERLHLLHRQADHAAAVVVALVRRLVAAGAERLIARARQHDRADPLVPTGAGECVDQLLAGPAAEGVHHLGAVDGDGGDAVGHLEQDVFVLHGRSLPFSRPWSGRRTR